MRLRLSLPSSARRDLEGGEMLGDEDSGCVVKGVRSRILGGYESGFYFTVNGSWLQLQG